MTLRCALRCLLRLFVRIHAHILRRRRNPTARREWQVCRWRMPPGFMRGRKWKMQGVNAGGRGWQTLLLLLDSSSTPPTRFGSFGYLSSRRPGGSLTFGQGDRRATRTLTRDSMKLEMGEAVVVILWSDRTPALDTNTFNVG